MAESIVLIEGTIEAISPIQHGGDEKTGSTPVLRSILHWDPVQGRHVRLPFISGNAIRGLLRRLVFADMLSLIGADRNSLHPKVYHALFSGGVLESGEETSSIELEMRRKLRTEVPAIGLFGLGIGNQLVPGSLRVRHAFPVCSEYAPYLRDELRGDARAQHSARTFTDVSFATRRDELRAERAEDETAVQMKVDFEAFIPGTLFCHGFALVYPSDLEVACLGRAIGLWKAVPFIGGKSGSGHGHVRLDYSPVPDEGPYVSYTTENSAVILSWLEKLGEGLAR